MIHSFNISHCGEDHTQGGDPICRGYDETPRCDGVLAGVVLDCTKDEFAYFQPHPAAGSRLAEHPEENVWNSPYLITDRPAPAVTAALRNQKSGLCLSAGDAGTVVQRPCTGGSTGSRQWRRTIDDTGHLTLSLGDRCLTMPSRTVPGKDDDVPVLAARLAPCAAGDDRQQWWMEDGYGPAGDHYEFLNAATRQRLQIEDGSEEDGARVVQPGGGDPARFKMEFTGAPASAQRLPTGTVRITGQDARRCLAAPGGGRTGSVPVPVRCAKAPAGRTATALSWRFVPGKGGAADTVQIRTAGRTPVCLTSSGAEPGRTAGVRLARCTTGSPQRWTAERRGSGVRLRSVATGRFLTLTEAAGRVALGQRSAGAAQEFVLRRA
nr:RICIN domain-containing protein [Streptomyces sp. SID5785]